MTSVDVVSWIGDASRLVSDQSQMLADLDAATGDGDHGHNLERGLRAAREALREGSATTTGAQLQVVGRALVTKGGGASGVLWGAFFKAASKAHLAQPDDDVAALAAALLVGVDAMQALGAAELGDKTMLDVLSPSLTALGAALAAGTPEAAALAEAAAVARDASEATGPLRARKGRAAYVGDRSIGHVDPGACSAAMIVGALTSALVR